jgi:hypothetical protein
MAAMGLNEVVTYAPLVSAIAVSTSLIIAVVVGILQIVHMNKRQRQQTARAIFSDFIKTSIERPIFAFPSRFPKKFDFDKE